VRRAWGTWRAWTSRRSAPDLIRTRQVLSYIVPPGDNVLLATVQNVGAGNALIVHQTEEIFSPAP
jgi:hypothetical protein